MNDALGSRMKTYYETVSRTKLMRRTPVVLRIDGKAFHTFTRKFHKPFDDVLIGSMQDTMKYLCQNIMGCVLGYTQSDEISLLLIDYDKLTSEAWFDYEVQKMASISASMATFAFFRTISNRINDLINMQDPAKYGENDPADIYASAAWNIGAMFDARCFNIPKEEVTNYFLWRQLDAARNSVQMTGHAEFSQKEMHGLSNSMIQDKLFLERGINWNDLPTVYKRGSCCIRIETPEGRHKWVIDTEIPEFKGENRDYIEKYLTPSEQ